MSAFASALEHVFGIEGGFVDDVRDSGGATKYGITEEVARAFGYVGHMKDLAPEDARRIYRARYWDALRLDEVAELSAPIAREVFDTAVNCGVSVSGQFLQRALNAMNREQKDYPDVTVDGMVGAMTISALKSFIYRRGQEGETVLLRALNVLQGCRYIELAERRQKDEAFVFGWLRNRVVIL